MAHTHVEHVREGTSDSGMGFLMGMILLMLFIFLMFYYGLPVLQNGLGQNQAPQINLPSKGQLDVNVNQSK